MLEDLKPDTAKRVLKTLRDENPSLRDLIDSTIERTLSETDWAEISEELFGSLELIQACNVWDNAGGDEFGYTDPLDAASELVEEETAPFRDEMARYLRGHRRAAAQYCCQGILHGLYRFAQESRSEFRECGSDSLFDHFGDLLSEWRRNEPSEEARAEMARFLGEHCPKWAK